MGASPDHHDLPIGHVFMRLLRTLGGHSPVDEANGQRVEMLKQRGKDSGHRIIRGTQSSLTSCAPQPLSRPVLLEMPEDSEDLLCSKHFHFTPPTLERGKQKTADFMAYSTEMSHEQLDYVISPLSSQHR